MERNLLVVIDMVNGFINCGALADKKINKITPNIEKLIQKAKKENTKIIAFKDTHIKGDEEFKMFPEHCVKGTKECELIPELKKYEKDMFIIEKNTTNGFITNSFTNIINNVNFDNIIVSGCCTDICVENFVISLLNFIEDNNRKTKVYVVEDACYTFDGEMHNAQKCHNESILKMENAGAKIVQQENKYVDLLNQEN